MDHTRLYNIIIDISCCMLLCIKLTVKIYSYYKRILYINNIIQSIYINFAFSLL